MRLYPLWGLRPEDRTASPSTLHDFRHFFVSRESYELMYPRLS